MDQMPPSRENLRLHRAALKNMEEVLRCDESVEGKDLRQIITFWSRVNPYVEPFLVGVYAGVVGLTSTILAHIVSTANLKAAMPFRKAPLVKAASFAKTRLSLPLGLFISAGLA